MKTPIPENRSSPDKRYWRGCLLGGAVGDALGAAVEFLPRDAIIARHGVKGITTYALAYGRKGAITDDTQMTMFTAEGLLRAHATSCMRSSSGGYTGATAHAFLRWLLTQGERPAPGVSVGKDGWLFTRRELHHRRAPGVTCVSALRVMTDFTTPANNDSKGCGGVMRVAPIGMLAASYNGLAEDDALLQQTFQLAVENAAITHGHVTGQLPAGVLAVVLALVLSGQPIDTAVARSVDILVTYDSHRETLSALEHALKLAATRPRNPDAVSWLGEGWIAEEALAISVYCALCAETFHQGVTLAVNHNGDSDSTGSITGNMLGARYGLDAIPKQLLEELELRDALLELADDLADANNWQTGEYTPHSEDDLYWQKYPRW